jgi:hypothetical protein
VREQRKEVGNPDAFWVPARVTLFGKKRKRGREFVDDANSERPREPEKMGTMENRRRPQRAGCPGNIDAAVLDCEGMVEQTLDKGEPRLADNRARAKQLPVGSTQRQLARFSQYLVDKLERQGWNIARRTGNCLVFIEYYQNKINKDEASVQLVPARKH